MALEVTGNPALLESAREALFTAAASLETTLPPWPEDPPGFRIKVRNGYRYLLHSAYEGTPDALHAELRSRAKAFARRHGAFAVMEHHFPSVVLVPEGIPFPAGLPRGAPREAFAYCDAGARRLYCRGLPGKNTVNRAVLAREALKLFWALRYGHLMPRWLTVGEGEAAYEEALNGKALPSVSRERYDALPRTARPLEEVTGPLADENPALFADHAFLYAAVFRTGDRALKKAFDAFLAAYRETGDDQAAAREHLFSVDGAKWTSAEEKLLKKGLKPLKRRGKPQKLNRGD